MLRPMSELFEQPGKEGYTPLADRLRPETIDDVVGQDHILGPNAPLRLAITSNTLPSIIFWGPPGSGKTSIAAVIAKTIDANFHWFSAVLSGVKDLREIIDTAEKQRKIDGKKTILFVDEIHRWNKAQQDAFLPHIERGTIILLGATTENPSFEVISPLLSRSKVYVLKSLTEDGLSKILDRSIASLKVKIADDARKFIIASSDGDARRLLNTLELATTLRKTRTITLENVEAVLQKRSMMYDKQGEEHYNIISAFIKSMRGSQPDAALYWLARMLEAGEEPLFIARRMVIFASEDVGNADPKAVTLAISCMQSFDFVGMPEGWIPLAQCASYLASAPKSKASYEGYLKAKEDVDEHGYLPVPLNLRNAPTKLMKDLDYGKGYKRYGDQQYLPDKIQNKIYYEPTENGYEKYIKERLKTR